MKLFRTLLVVISFWSLAACSSGRNVVLPTVTGAAAARHSMSTASAVPGDNPSALPGDNPSALPGDNPSALPGAQLACDLTFQTDQANCTVAINLNVSPNPNAGTPASLLPGLHPADLQSAYALP
ncbi:MAG: hypothetical protein ACYDG0_05420, partial [Vulcanimicrobiaceae bacterium]